MAVSKKLQKESQEFFNRVSVLNEKLEVSKECNELLESLKKHSIKTVSTYLIEYRKPFKMFIHENPDLNETIQTKNGTHTQHCAVSMLALTEDQQTELIEKKKETSHARDGFDKDGEIRDVDLPTIDIKKIIDMSCECLMSDNPHIIAAGIVNLTGLRANEQNMPRYEHKILGIVEREMIVLDEFVIAFKGISKKRNEDDAQAFYARPTLAPAQMIVDAQKKYLSYRAVQTISTDINTYQKTFQQQFKNEYKKIFGKLFTTIEMYDDDGELSDDKINGTPHKGRAFYACVLRAILKGKYFGSSAINTYVQLALVHDNIAETMKYLGRYDESLYINPVNINIPTNIKGLGEVYIEPTVKTEIKLDEKFNLMQFIEGLSNDNQLTIAEFLNDGMGETQAILALIELLSDTDSKKNHNQSDESGLEIVTRIVDGIMDYNRDVCPGEWTRTVDGAIDFDREVYKTKIVVPTYGLINKIYQKTHGKQMAPKTVRTFFERNKEVNEELEEMGVVGGVKNDTHNGVHFRKTFNKMIESILVYVSER